MTPDELNRQFLERMAEILRPMTDEQDRRNTKAAKEALAAECYGADVERLIEESKTWRPQ